MKKYIPLALAIILWVLEYWIIIIAQQNYDNASFVWWFFTAIFNGIGAIACFFVFIAKMDKSID